MNETKQNSRFGKIGVLMGGTSAEREVSLKSGQAILQSLLRSGLDAFELILDSTAVQQILDHPMDRAFIALHGRGGEDGCLQGVLEWLKIPYTGSGVLASALAMDKYKTKQVWQFNGLPTPKSEIVDKHTDFVTLKEKFDFPIMIKPNHEGSSIGLTKVTSKEQLAEAIKQAEQFDNDVLAETFIEGKEYTVSVLDGQALPVICVKPATEFYDFEAKYTRQDTQYILPCGLHEHQESMLQSLALKAFNALNCRGWARVDFMLDRNKNPWLIEINTSPGMTEKSLFPKAAAHAGLLFDDLIIRILRTSQSWTNL